MALAIAEQRFSATNDTGLKWLKRRPSKSMDEANTLFLGKLKLRKREERNQYRNFAQFINF